jgi:hypothetical protein
VRKMSWKDSIKKVNLGGGEERFPDSERDWMEDDAENAFNPERHINGVIKDILGSATFGGGLLDDIEERLGKEEEQAHISFPRGFDKAKVRKQLLPIIEEIVRSTIEVDMSKYKYSGP